MAKVLLADFTNQVSARSEVLKQLQGYFNQIKDAGGIPVTCEWLAPDATSAKTTVTQSDMLLFYLPYGGASVAREKYPDAPSPIHGHGGLTIGMDPRVAEVYGMTADADLLAKLSFHELMHMKLKSGNEMHTQAGLAAAKLDAASVLTKENVAAMKAALSTNVPQFGPGIDILQRIKREMDRDGV